jgi:hypothetical protein
MIQLKQRDPDIPVETTMTLIGQEFGITLRPLPRKERVTAFAEVSKRKGLMNPVTNKMDFVDYFDYKDPKVREILDNLLDKCVIDFEDIILNGATLDGKLRSSKIAVGSIKIEDVEEIKILDPDTGLTASIIPRPRTRYFSELILDKCEELAEISIEAETKN